VIEHALRAPFLFLSLSLSPTSSYHILIRSSSQDSRALRLFSYDVDYLQEYFRKKQLKRHLVSRADIRSDVGGQMRGIAPSARICIHNAHTHTHTHAYLGTVAFLLAYEGETRENLPMQRKHGRRFVAMRSRAIEISPFESGSTRGSRARL